MECASTITTTDLLRRIFIDEYGSQVVTCETQYLSLDDLIRQGWECNDLTITDFIRGLFVDENDSPQITCETQYLSLDDLIRQNIVMGIDGQPVLSLRIAPSWIVEAAHAHEDRVTADGGEVVHLKSTIALLKKICN